MIKDVEDMMALGCGRYDGGIKDEEDMMAVLMMRKM